MRVRFEYLGPVVTVAVGGQEVITVDGEQWKFTSDWLQGDEQIIKPLVKSTAAKYAADKMMTARDGADCQS